MGYSKVRAGDRVIGQGSSPSTGKRIQGKLGWVDDVRDHLGDDVVCVTWDDGGTDEVRQDNVSGTQQGVFGRGGRATSDPEPENQKKRRWGRR